MENFVMRDTDVCGLGNAIVDILTEIPESFLTEHHLEKGSMVLVDPEVQQELLTAVGSRSPALVSGGSVANSIIALAQLGGAGALIGVTGDDNMGDHYRRECQELEIKFSALGTQPGRSGTSLIMVTPDAERTMRTALGVSALLSEKFVDEALIERSKWLFVEGYLFSNPDLGFPAVQRAVEVAKSVGTKVALTLSAKWVLMTQRDALMSVLPSVDLLLANDEEAFELAGVTTVEAAMPALLKLCPEVVVTAGAEGAYHGIEGSTAKVAAFECEPVDMTGAGDMLAGAYLYGIGRGLPPGDALRKACFLAKQVISQVGARYGGNAKAEWASA